MSIASIVMQYRVNFLSISHLSIKIKYDHNSNLLTIYCYVNLSSYILDVPRYELRGTYVCIYTCHVSIYAQSYSFTRLSRDYSRAMYHRLYTERIYTERLAHSWHFFFSIYRYFLYIEIRFSDKFQIATKNIGLKLIEINILILIFSDIIRIF